MICFLKQSHKNLQNFMVRQWPSTVLTVLFDTVSFDNTEIVIQNNCWKRKMHYAVICAVVAFQKSINDRQQPWAKNEIFEIFVFYDSNIWHA